jgi:hypothetical protein
MSCNGIATYTIKMNHFISEEQRPGDITSTSNSSSIGPDALMERLDSLSIRRRTSLEEMSISMQLPSRSAPSVSNLSSDSSGMEYSVDDTWDITIDGVQLTTAEHGVRASLTDRGMCSMYNGRMYIYLPNGNWWAPVQDAAALKVVCNAAGYDNVSVNYAMAAECFMTLLNRCAILNEVRVVPKSICVGIRRLAISVSDTEIRFTTAHCPPARLPSTYPDTTKSMCVLPIDSPIVPSVVERGFNCSAYEFFRPFFGNEVEYHSALWVVGNSLIDPVKTSKCVILVGPGGTGKSTFMSYLVDSIGSCADVIPAHALYGNKSMSSDVATYCCTKRIVISPDVDFAQNPLNVQNYKLMMGNDYLATQPVKSKASCSMFIGCNTLPDPATTSEWTTTAISRRTIVIPMTTSVDKYLATHLLPISNEQRMEFLLKAIEIRLEYNNPPLSARSVMLTLCGYRYLSLIADLRYTDEGGLSESIEAQALASRKLGISTKSMGELARNPNLKCKP